MPLLDQHAAQPQPDLFRVGMLRTQCGQGRAVEFAQKVKAGVAVVNGGTYGSEPHMPFGGRRQSGNGTREPGTEALDVYSELKDIYVNVDPQKL